MSEFKLCDSISRNFQSFSKYSETLWCFNKFSFHRKWNDARLLLIKMVHWSLYKTDTLKADISIRRTVWRGTDCPGLRSSHPEKLSIKRTSPQSGHLSPHQRCPPQRDPTSHTSCATSCRTTKDLGPQEIRKH